MSAFRDACIPNFRRLGKSELASLNGLQFESVERFLEPLPLILLAVARGLAHRVVGIEAGSLAGFYAVHPDARDSACWWLGWLAIDRRRHGQGLGRAALRSALDGLARVPGCRRVRLLVAADNTVARRMYETAGFGLVAVWPGTGELVLEAPVAHGVPAGPRIPPVAIPAGALILAMALRLWRRGVPPAARMSGEFHGPPGCRIAGVPPCPAHPHALHAAA